MKKYILDYAFLLGIASVIVGLDQWTKHLVRTLIPLGGSWSPWSWLEPYARFVHWQNTGAAFGMFQNFGLVFTILAFIVTLAILYYFPRIPRHESILRLAMTMQLGGAVGNLIDRLTQGTVTDFISVGTAVLVLAVWLAERKQKKEALVAPEIPAPVAELEWLPDNPYPPEQLIDAPIDEEKHLNGENTTLG